MTIVVIKKILSAVTGEFL